MSCGFWCGTNSVMHLPHMLLQASVQSCVLASNSANDTGGAYCALHNSKGNFTDSVIENNVAANAGGALYIRDSVVVGAPLWL